MRWISWFASLTILLLTGCAAYHLGPTNGLSAGSRSVQVNIFHNNTLEPRLNDALATALRRNLQQDGTYRLDTHGSGDIVVNGTIFQYDRSGVSFEPTDVLTVRDFIITISAKVTAIDRGTGRTVLDREVYGRTTLRAGPDLASAERQALPLLADDLARNITSLLVDGTW
jgi:hypothetical protein